MNDDRTSKNLFESTSKKRFGLRTIRNVVEQLHRVVIGIDRCASSFCDLLLP